MTSAQSHPGYGSLLMRADDFFALGETQERYELINGVDVMSPCPRPIHTKILDEVLRQLYLHEHSTSVRLEIYFETDLFIDRVHRLPSRSLRVRAQAAAG